MVNGSHGERREATSHIPGGIHSYSGEEDDISIMKIEAHTLSVGIDVY